MRERSRWWKSVKTQRWEQIRRTCLKELMRTMNEPDALQLTRLRKVIEGISFGFVWMKGKIDEGDWRNGINLDAYKNEGFCQKKKKKEWRIFSKDILFINVEMISTSNPSRQGNNNTPAIGIVSAQRAMDNFLIYQHDISIFKVHLLFSLWIPSDLS